MNGNRAKRTQAARNPLRVEKITGGLFQLLNVAGQERVPVRRRGASKPRLLDPQVIASARTFREIVRLCWASRTRPGMTQRLLAEECGAYASHICDYLSADESKRELPARYIVQFQVSCGNLAICQWLALRAGLVVSNAAPACSKSAR